MKRALYAAAGLLGTLVVVGILLSGSWTSHQAAGEKGLRVVSLSPSVTEMLFALGVGDCVVGVTNRCDYPPQAKDIDCIGRYGAPSIEKLLAVAPDLVVATGAERPLASAGLKRAGINVVWLQTGNFAEMFEGFRIIGREVGEAQQAETVVARMEAQLETIARQYQDVDRDRRPRVFLEIWHDPVTTVGEGSFLDEIITRAGGVNVAGGLNSDYPAVSPEKVIQWNPDVIVLGYMTQKGSEEALCQRIGWDEIAAVRSRRIINDIPPDILLRPGPRAIEGVKALARRLHGWAEESLHR